MVVTTPLGGTRVNCDPQFLLVYKFQLLWEEEEAMDHKMDLWSLHILTFLLTGVCVVPSLRFPGNDGGVSKLSLFESE